MAKLYLFTIIIIMVAINVRTSSQNQEIPYEPVDTACVRCKCVNEESVVPPVSHYILNCANRGFKQILAGYPKEFGIIPADKEIDISFSGNDIRYLQQLPETEAIVFFSCRHCKLTDIASAAFIDVINILRLDLRWNKLTADVLRPDIFRGRFNDAIYEPINLEDIDFGHNDIESLDPLLFEHTPNLKRLSLAFNPIEHLYEKTVKAITSAKQMEHLDLSHINIDSLPEELFNRTMPKLRELLVQGNRLLTIPESLGSVGHTLRSLYIGGNLITKLNDESFLGLNTLTHLFIGDMSELEEIEIGTFSYLIALEVLSCRNNTKLKRFDLGGLISSLHLRELDLTNCALKSLDITMPREPHFESINGKPDTEIFELAKLRLLKLEDNPWHCDCALYKSLEKLEHYGSNAFHSDDEARCSSPYHLSGTLLSDLSKLSICSTTSAENQKPPYVKYEPPAFLRPRAILLTMLSILAVIIIGLIVGFTIVEIKKRLRNSERFGSPIRYTTVRNSTISTSVNSQSNI